MLSALNAAAHYTIVLASKRRCSSYRAGLSVNFGPSRRKLAHQNDEITLRLPADEHGSVSGYDGPQGRYDCAAAGVYRFDSGVYRCGRVQIPCVQVRKIGTGGFDCDAESVSFVGLASLAP